MKIQTTIDPQFLEAARKALSTVDALNLLTLISVGPGQYKTKDLAFYCKAQRSNISTSLKRLQQNDWIRYSSLGKNGILLWFIKSDLSQVPDKVERPSWILSDKQAGQAESSTQIFVGEVDVFAAIHGLNPRTVRNFLNGNPRSTLAGRWKVKQRLPLSM